MSEASIFEKSVPARRAYAFDERAALQAADASMHALPASCLRAAPADLPECSELDVVRHFTRLSQRNFAIDSHFYPLGSCTMKYNPRAAQQLALLPEFAGVHPLQPISSQQAWLHVYYELQHMLADITGMQAVSLAPMAGAQGEWVGVAMIKAYHTARADSARCEILVPDAAHGTNPASAVMCGYKVRNIATTPEGDLDLAELAQHCGPQTAGIMLTNPSTLGVFERQITLIADIVHSCGGLLYYDGANLNAILGHFRPGDMGFDVMHLNCHKTFATPHGGGGPGAGPVAAAASLAAFLPQPQVIKVNPDNTTDKPYYSWQKTEACAESIGRVSSFYGNAGVLLRTYVYLKMLGRQGLPRVASMANLNANYLQEALRDIGYQLAFPKRRASHEFLITLEPLTKKYAFSALDVAKRLLDLGFHAPTIYFPLQVPECLLIEPTETESKQTLDAFVAAMKKIMHEIKHDAEVLRKAPLLQAVQRLDEVRAARQLDLAQPLMGTRES